MKKTGHSKKSLDHRGKGSRWATVNYDPQGTRYNISVTSPNLKNVDNLSLLWSDINPLASVEGTPIIRDNVVYTADTAGVLLARNLDTGDVIWQFSIPNVRFDGPPLATKDRIYAVPSNLILYALDRFTGNVIYSVPVDPSVPAGEPAVYGGITEVEGLILVPVAGQPITELEIPASTLRCSLNALRASDGSFVWRFYTNPPVVPDLALGAGVAVWSSPVVDTKLKLLFVGTGNAYRPPAGPYSDSLLAIKYETGELVWNYQFLANDVYSVDYPLGPDRDVGSSPNLFKICQKGKKLKVVGLNSKLGIYKVFERKTGNLVWSTPITTSLPTIWGCPGAAVTDGVVYTATSRDPYNILTGPFGVLLNSGDPEAFTIFLGAITTSLIGVVTAMEADTGKVLWSTEVTGCITGSVTGAGNLLYVATNAGSVFVLNAENGRILFSYQFLPIEGIPVMIGGPISVVQNRVAIPIGLGIPGLPGGVGIFSL